MKSAETQELPSWENLLDSNIKSVNNAIALLWN